MQAGALHSTLQLQPCEGVRRLTSQGIGVDGQAPSWSVSTSGAMLLEPFVLTGEEWPEHEIVCAGSLSKLAACKVMARRCCALHGGLAMLIRCSDCDVKLD